MRDSCKDTGDCIRYALELEQAILQWYSEQTDVQQRRKKDESITKNSLDTAKVSLDALASMLNASSSDELPKGVGESLAERIELDSPKDRQKQLRVAVIGGLRSFLPDNSAGSNARLPDSVSGFRDSCRRRNGCPSCREHEAVFSLLCATDWLSGIPESS